MKTYFLFFALLFLNFSTNAQDSTLELYFNALLQYDFKAAQSHIKGVNNKKVAQKLENISYLMADAGQQPTAVTLQKIDPKTPLIHQYLNHIQNGYLTLYADPYTTTPFDSFNQALVIARALHKDFLIKRALLGLLEVYDFELVISNDGYSDTLEQYRALCTTDEERYWYELHKHKFSVHYISSSNLALLDLSDLELNLNQLPENHPLWADYFSYKAHYFELNNQQDKAIQYHNKAIATCKDKNYLRHIAFRSSIRLMLIHLNNNDLKKAELQLSIAAQYKNLADTLRAQYYLTAYQSELANAKKEFENAFNLQKKLRQYRIQMDYRENTLKIAQANVKYQTEKKERQILEEQLQKKKLTISLGGGIAVISILSLFLYLNGKRKQAIAEKEKQIQAQKTEKILKDKELESINAMLIGQEKERKRLAAELHDNLGSTLVTVRMHINHLEQHIDKVKNPKEYISNTYSLIDDAYQKVRHISHEKNIGVLPNEGLLPALDNLTKNISKTGKIALTLEEFGLNKRLNGEMEITLFRIIQELVTNMVKHSQATEGNINLTQFDNELSIIIEDNGIGFDVTKYYNSKKAGMGLGSIEKRIEHLNGTMEIDSTISKGTSILIDLPI